MPLFLSFDAIDIQHAYTFFKIITDICEKLELTSSISICYIELSYYAFQ